MSERFDGSLHRYKSIPIKVIHNMPSNCVGKI